MSKVESKVIARRTERVKVTMEWEVDAEVEDHESPGMVSRGWFSDYGALFAACDPKRPLRTTIQTIGGRATTDDEGDK